MEESESAVKQVLSTLWSYLYSSLPPNEDFIIQLEIDGILARNDATKLRASARLGGRACIQDLIIFMYDFFDEPALEKFCTFLDKYGQPTRPLMLEVAAKIREEMGLKLQPVHELTPEDPQKGTSRPRADVGDGTSSADLNQHVYLPVIDDLKTSFSTLAGNVLDIIDSLSDRNLKTFSTNFLLNYLKPSFPPDAPLPVIPETVEDLKLFLICRWDSLQIALLKTVVEHLGSRKIEDATFKASVQQVKADLIAYEDLLKGKLPEFLSKCRSESVSLKPLLGHSSVSVKIASNPEEISLARIIKLKRFFINQLGLSDTVFIGFSEGCIVLFFSIPTECVWSLPSCLLPSNLSLLEEWKVLFLSVKGAFTVDIKERRVIDSLDKIEEKVSFKEEPVVKTKLSPDPDIKTEFFPYMRRSKPFSKRFKTAVPDYLTYEPPLEKKAETEKPPRNWRELKCRKTLECGGWCQSIAVQGDIVCIGVKGRVLLFSKTSGAQVHQLGSDQIKGAVYGVAFIDEDTIVVSADDKRLRTYTTKGQLVRTFDSGKGGFTPRGLTVGPDGHIFVCDVGNDCVCVFNVDGTLLRSSFGSKGSGVGHFNGPRDVCMGGEGLLFISDRDNSRICVHSVKGAFIREFPTPRKPYYVAATHCNHLVVSSWFSDAVMIMTTSGQLVHEFGGEGRGPGQAISPHGVAVDNEDCVYVCDYGNSRVQVY